MTAALILAAGSSRRMMQNKLRLLLRGKAVIAHVADAVLAAGFDPVIVVTGHDKTVVKEVLAGLPLGEVHNPDHLTGMASSLKTGIKALPADTDGVLVCLADMPLVSAAEMRRLKEAFSPGDGIEICIPTFDGQWGNPVLIGRNLFLALEQLDGDRGARALFAAHGGKIRELAMESPSVLTDMDTMDAYAKIVGEVSR